MTFTETSLSGAFVIDLERLEDDRGFFARTFCEQEFAARGLHTAFPQCNVSFNRHKGTLRGMHYQVAPHAEAKVARCTMGAIHDVIIDLRPDSPTFTKHYAAELSADNRKAIYIPEGMAHGFITLTDSAEAFYMMSAAYAPDCARGVRWDDPVFGITWPLAPHTIAPRDAEYPDFEPGRR